MNPLLIIFPQFSDLIQEMEKALKAGEVKRAGEVIIGFEQRYPLASGVIKSLFTGTPAEVVDKVAAYWPGVRLVPDIEAIAEKLQAWLFSAWNKQRGGKAIEESTRSKA